LATKSKVEPKKIVYLWGAGATQGEAQNLGATVSLLMGDTLAFGEGVATRILRGLGSRRARSVGISQGVDIEKLISLLGATGVNEQIKLAEGMRTRYFEELRDSLGSAGVLYNPALAFRLFEMHLDANFSRNVESLTGILTTNHDGLLQLASEKVFKALNLGFPFESRHFSPAIGGLVPPILQLHGSFTWQFGVPITVKRLQKTSRYDPDTAWIPPTILKESKNYPFNKIAAFAYELLTKGCDVLRVVGASLTQNDWNVLSLIFNAQRHRELTGRSAFRIELIMPSDAGEEIKEECGYLKNVMPIAFLSEGNFAAYKEFAPYKESEIIPAESDLANPFKYWLAEKLQYHKTMKEIENGDLIVNAESIGEAA